MHIVIAFMIFAGLIAGFHPFGTTPKGEINLAVGTDESLRIHPKVTPMTEYRDDCTVKQEFDYSCGSAALGTLLNYYLGENFSEKQIIQGLMAYGDKEQIKQLRAFSFWDMQQFVTRLGYTSGGYNASFSDLEDPEIWPCIVPIEIFGYRHFVVLKGIYKGHVFVADPWRGNSSFPVPQFQAMWYSNILFMIEPKNKRSVTCLALTEKDLRFIDKDMEKTLMFDFDQPFDLPREWQTDFYTGEGGRYKR